MFNYMKRVFSKKSNHKDKNNEVLKKVDSSRREKKWIHRWRKKYKVFSMDNNKLSIQHVHFEDKRRKANYEDFDSVPDILRSFPDPRKAQISETDKHCENSCDQNQPYEKKRSIGLEIPNCKFWDDLSDRLSLDEGSEFSSGTNTECDFTDSEGKPNPFIGEFDMDNVLQSKIPAVCFVLQKEFPSPQKCCYGQNPKRTIQEYPRTPEVSVPYLGYFNRLEYKTPTLSERLKSDEVFHNAYMARSTERAFNLKKNWVNENNVQISTFKKIDAAEMDSKLKNVLERLSSQQSLLKPAERPSKQMEHLLKNCQATRVSLSQSIPGLRRDILAKTAN